MTSLPPRPVRWEERVRFVIATPALWRAVGEEPEVRREVVSLISDWSSRSRRWSWVVVKRWTSTDSSEAMLKDFSTHLARIY